ncbi:DinB family protein [uncultured Aquimarina sp.]|uniref:DinB family protein n=1 Tax=uncultured Aquimarina sp. TaxID=575652 RepID=UPI002615B1C1|nr:DinB family protein [uncultured Aquimarina sp.]
MTQGELIKKWKGNRRFTLKFVDIFPEEDFEFKPTPEMKSYKSQLSHITSWLRTHSRFVIDETFEKAKMTSRDLIRLALEDFFDTFIERLEKMDESQFGEIVDVWYGKTTRYQIANIMDNHLSHHRGQMIVYLRLKNHKPPSYIGW